MERWICGAICWARAIRDNAGLSLPGTAMSRLLAAVLLSMAAAPALALPPPCNAGMVWADRNGNGAIEAGEAADRRFDRAVHRLVLRHVGLDEERLAARGANLALRTLAGFAADVRERDFRAFVYERFRGRLGDSGAAAGQKCDLAVELAH